VVPKARSLRDIAFRAGRAGLGDLAALRDHVLTHGCPPAFYSDRHGIFRVDAKAERRWQDRLRRVVERLDIGSINALTRQARCRVEPADQTLQDRLVKELRLRNICSIAVGQAYLAEFMIAWNKTFAVPPRDAASAHRPRRWTWLLRRMRSGC
jgi:hypothetical protein